MSISPVIVWFRHDLRLGDNPALSAAAKTKAPIVPLYILEDGIGAASKWWLAQSLKSLKVPMVLRSGDAVRVLRDIIKETGAQAVYINRVSEPKGMARDRALDLGVPVHDFKGNVLFEPEELKTGSGGNFRVFTPFYKAGLKQEHLIGAALPAPRGITWAKAKSETLALLPKIKWDSRFYEAWTPGEDGAHTRARYFVHDLMAEYKTGRDRPGMDGTSRLSPHLHWGEISVRELWHMAAPHTGGAGFQRELVWRDFCQQLLYFYPKLPTEPLQAKFAAMPWQKDKAQLSAWQKGMTGYPIVDAGMRQLWQTGWMHNRVRMIVGSFLVKHLLQPWQDGERWFWDCLVDADLANNAGNWQWIAGCGADAAPYFRVFNPILQGQKFDPKGKYVREFVPELADVPDKFIHTPWETKMKLDYPAPIIDHAAGRARALEAFAQIRAA